MPKENIRRKSAQKLRVNNARRKEGSPVIRRRGSHRAAEPAVIADSIHTLRLKPIPGPVVFFNGEKKDLAHDDVDAIGAAIFEAYRRLRWIYHKEKVTVSLLASDIPLGIQVYLKAIREMLPKGCDVNIQEDGGRFSLVIYAVGDIEYGWHCFEAGPTIQILEKKNPRLLQCFLHFLSALRGAGIGIWEDDIFGGYLFEFDDIEIDLEQEAESTGDYEEYEEFVKTKHQYKEGAPAKYAQIIRALGEKKRTKIPVKKIQQWANRFRNCDEVANVIYQGCELLIEGNDLFEYKYNYMDIEDYYLELDLQFCIPWKYNDTVTDRYEEYINNIANEGIQDPVASLQPTRKTPMEEIQQLKTLAAWPGQLGKFMWRANELLIKFKAKHERKNKRAA